jgi:hypothetical protein
MTTDAQILTLRPGPEHAVTIETPMGLIRIERLTRDTRKIEITLPMGLRANRETNHKNDRNGYFVREDDGQLVPAYDMLVPLRDGKGALIGAARPTAFELIEENSDGRHESLHPMANS